MSAAPQSPADRRPDPHAAPVAAPGAVLGVVLAGGKARRMGGGDKGLLSIGARSMLDCLLDRLAPQLGGRDALILNANGDPARFAPTGLPVIADDAGEGPLAGVLAGMETARTRGAAWILTAAADTPFAPTDLLARLAAAREAQAADIVLAATRDDQGVLRDHPTFGLWSTALAGPLRTALADEGVRKVVAFTDRFTCIRAAFPSPDPATGLDPFFNVNTPDDLRRAEAAAVQLGG